jgi:hypothetical protein
MAEDEIKKEQKSSTESTKEIINRAKNARTNINRARTGARVASQAGRAGAQIASQAGRAGAQAAVQGAAAGVETMVTTVSAGVTALVTSEIWVPLLVIGGIILLIVLTGVISFMTDEEVNAGSDLPVLCADIGGTCSAQTNCSDIPNSQPNSTASCNDTTKPTCCVPTSQACGATPTCPTGNYLNCIQSQFGVTMGGSYTASDLNKIFNGWAIGFQYPTFLAWFKSVHPSVTVSSLPECPTSLWCSGAWATVESGARMTLYQNFLNSAPAYQHYVLVHEAGHMAAQANQSANNAQYTLYSNGLSKNSNCYNSSGVLLTFPLDLIPSEQRTYDRKVAESWADSIADTVFCPINTSCPSNGGGGAPISNFPETCSYIYNYVKSVLGCP